MKGRFLLAGVALLLAPAAAGAQVTANPVTAAADAFGFRIGEETVGIYDESSVRGFDLEAAGNYRVNGICFVQQRRHAGRRRAAAVPAGGDEGVLRPRSGSGAWALRATSHETSRACADRPEAS